MAAESIHLIDPRGLQKAESGSKVARTSLKHVKRSTRRSRYPSDTFQLTTDPLTAQSNQTPTRNS